MAQQTINIGASPNDGTGTPLRTAFQYTNSNFSELYTAVGPSGNNIVVPGSATITGDLTVDTSTLKVDSANNRVIVGHTSGASAFQVSNGGAAGFEVQPTGVNSAPAILSYNRSTSAWIQLTYGASSHVFQLSGSDGMTLNSTGLGVGVSPAATIHGYSASGSAQMRMQNGTAVTGRTWYFNSFSDGNLYIGIPTVIDALTVTPSGNVGIGVAPSAWATYKAVSVGGIGASVFGLGTSQAGVAQGAFFNNGAGSGWAYSATSQVPTYYLQINGENIWNIAASGTAGAQITAWTPAMKLDASGNLLVGTTSALASGSTFQNLGTARQVLTLKGDAFGSYTAGIWNASTTNDGLFVYFGTETTLSVRGGISYNRGGGLVAYNTTSDYRAKDIIGPVSNSGSLIDSLKVYVGKMKGATIERPMLIAHEAQAVAPYAVTGTKDEVDADGNPKYQQMDVSALVPVLIAEIQSLRARVQTLEAR